MYTKLSIPERLKDLRVVDKLQALHLSDAMVELLSSGKINNRLLCELATHPNFQRLMVDMEIFIDRIADMRIEQMNLILEATRQTVIRDHAPGENDLYMRTLELGQVQESDFFSTSSMTIWIALSGISGRPTKETAPAPPNSLLPPN